MSAAGNSSMFAAMLRSISRAGPLATGVAFAGVALLVAILFGNIRSTALVLTSLLTGLLWMGGAGAAESSAIGRFVQNLTAVRPVSRLILGQFPVISGTASNGTLHGAELASGGSGSNG